MIFNKSKIRVSITLKINENFSTPTTSGTTIHTAPPEVSFPSTLGTTIHTAPPEVSSPSTSGTTINTAPPEVSSPSTSGTTIHTAPPDVPNTSQSCTEYSRVAGLVQFLASGAKTTTDSSKSWLSIVSGIFRCKLCNKGQCNGPTLLWWDASFSTRQT
ncbi:hypothetical protein DPMN_160180 [Dreissena polymorpha]|uniref:Uncharacterized protein n=1 Tax=Dreissena polymorpha TaxID=45954 RepID=A0A9D4EQQ1_DREPO|nr:hypothetical protein DPMN_160180 [Dreissena polymorpha]